MAPLRGLILSFVACSAWAAAPTLTHLNPVAGQQGTTVAVTASGTIDPWPPQVWVSGSGVTFKPGDKPKIFNVEIAPDAAPGPRLVRFFNQEGASGLRFFIVSDRPELVEKEPNDSYSSPQVIPSLPAVQGGRLDKGDDVDSYAVELKAGQTLVARVEGYILGSGFDGMLRVLDQSGVQHAFNHDGPTMDPLLTWKAPKDGTYIVQIMGFPHPANSSVHFTGGEGCVYRLHLHAGPYVRHTVPLAIPRGKKSPVQLVGFNLSADTTEVDCSQSPGDSMEALPLQGHVLERPIEVSHLPEIIENPRLEVQAFDAPGAVTGTIDPAGDDDRYTFTATKDCTYEIRLTAARIGSPLDGLIRILNSAAKEIARNDDAGGLSDPMLMWKAPADGYYTVVISDVPQRGGADFIYRLSIDEAKPAVTATVASHALKLEPEKPGELKVTVKRSNGFAAKLKLGAKNLPEGVTAPVVDVPDKDGEATLTLTSAAGAPGANQPFELFLKETESGKEHPVRYSLVSTSIDNGVPQGFANLVIESTEQIWLTVPPPPEKKPEPKPEPEKTPAPEAATPAPAKPASEPAKPATEPAKPADVVKPAAAPPPPPRPPKPPEPPKPPRPPEPPKPPAPPRPPAPPKAEA